MGGSNFGVGESRAGLGPMGRRDMGGSNLGVGESRAGLGPMGGWEYRRELTLG